MFGFGKKKDITCPFCKSHSIVASGVSQVSADGKTKVKYICNNCGKEFNK